MSDKQKKFSALKNIGAPVVLMLIIPLLLASCLDDFKGIKKIKVKDPYNPAFAVPVAHVNASLMDMLRFANQDSLAQIDPDKFMRLIYHGHPYKAYLRDYVRVPMQTFTTGPFKYATSNDSVRVTLPVYLSDQTEHVFNFNNGEEITKLKIKSGKLIVRLRSTFRKSGDIDIKINDAKLKNGSDFIHNVAFSFQPAGETFTYDTFDLSGCYFDLSKGGISENTIIVNYIITLNPNSYYIRKTDAFNVSISFDDIEFSYIEGFLGVHNIVYTPDSMLLDLFKNVEANKIQFFDPKIYIHFNNSAGIPIRIQPPDISAHSGIYSKQLTGSVLSAPIDLNYPSLQEVGKKSYTLFLATYQNSNVRELTNMAPSNFVSDLDITTNATGKNRNNFATDSSYLTADIVLELPLYGKAKDYRLEFDVNLDSIDMSIIEHIQLNVLSKNEIPIDFGLQFYLADTSRNILDSLVTSSSMLIKSGQVDDSGKVIKASQALTSFTLNKDILDANPDFKKIIIRAQASTLNNGNVNVKIYASNRLEIFTSIYIKLKIDL